MLPVPITACNPGFSTKAYCVHPHQINIKLNQSALVDKRTQGEVVEIERRMLLRFYLNQYKHIPFSLSLHHAADTQAIQWSGDD